MGLYPTKSLLNFGGNPDEDLDPIFLKDSLTFGDRSRDSESQSLGFKLHVGTSVGSFLPPP